MCNNYAKNKDKIHDWFNKVVNTLDIEFCYMIRCVAYVIQLIIIFAILHEKIEISAKFRAYTNSKIYYNMLKQTNEMHIFIKIMNKIIDGWDSDEYLINKTFIFEKIDHS